MKSFWLIVCLLFLSCNREQFLVTEKYVYNSKGFPNGLSVALLKLNEEPPYGQIPKDYSISVRFDLFREGKIRKEISFSQTNEGYYWQKVFIEKEKFEVLPLKFERNNWYII